MEKPIIYKLIKGIFGVSHICDANIASYMILRIEISIQKFTCKNLHVNTHTHTHTHTHTYFHTTSCEWLV